MDYGNFIEKFRKTNTKEAEARALENEAKIQADKEKKHWCRTCKGTGIETLDGVAIGACKKCTVEK
jgi:ribosomal protein L37AE/L43A